jgi:hypothetical protein
MQATYTVDEQKEFDAWFKEQQTSTQKVLARQREKLAEQAASKPAGAAPAVHH